MKLDLAQLFKSVIARQEEKLKVNLLSEAPLILGYKIVTIQEAV